MTGLVPAWAVLLVLLAALIAANLPFFNDRLFVVGPRRSPKTVAWRLLELLVFAALGERVAVLARARLPMRPLIEASTVQLLKEFTRQTGIKVETAADLVSKLKTEAGVL